MLLEAAQWCCPRLCRASRPTLPGPTGPARGGGCPDVPLQRSPCPRPSQQGRACPPSSCSAAPGAGSPQGTPRARLPGLLSVLASKLNWEDVNPSVFLSLTACGSRLGRKLQAPGRHVVNRPARWRLRPVGTGGDTRLLPQTATGPTFYPGRRSPARPAWTLQRGECKASSMAHAARVFAQERAEPHGARATLTPPPPRPASLLISASTQSTSEKHCLPAGWCRMWPIRHQTRTPPT